MRQWQYFGIDEDAEANRIDEEGLLGVESLAGLEAGARDLAKKAMQSAGFEDVSQLQDAVRNGALKVCRRFVALEVSELMSSVLQLSDFLQREG